MVPIGGRYMLWFRSAPGARPSRLTQRDCVREVHAKLQDGGWTVTVPKVAFAANMADLLCAKDSTRLAVKCVGTDRLITQTNINDLNRYASISRRNAIVADGSRSAEEAQHYRQDSETLLIAMSDVTRLDALLAMIPPIIIGAVDHITLPDTICGWAVLSPDCGPASVVAFLEDEPIGETVADKYRGDLRTYGHGCFAFALKVRRPLSKAEVASTLRLRAFVDGKYIGPIRFWEKVRVDE
jgi:hypothetical protein